MRRQLAILKGMFAVLLVIAAALARVVVCGFLGAGSLGCEILG